MSLTLASPQMPHEVRNLLLIRLPTLKLLSLAAKLLEAAPDLFISMTTDLLDSFQRGGVILDDWSIGHVGD